MSYWLDRRVRRILRSSQTGVLAFKTASCIYLTSTYCKASMLLEFAGQVDKDLDSVMPDFPFPYYMLGLYLLPACKNLAMG